MKKGIVVFIIFALMHASTVFAQDFDYHPILSDNFYGSTRNRVGDF